MFPMSDPHFRNIASDNVMRHFANISINQSINQVYFQINMYKNEQKVHISQIDRKKVEVEVSNL